MVAGIQFLEPGGRRLLIAPKPGGTITWARGRLRTPYGEVRTDWSVDDGVLVLAVDIPPNCSAVVAPPGHPRRDVGAGRHEFRYS